MLLYLVNKTRTVKINRKINKMNDTILKQHNCDHCDKTFHNAYRLRLHRKTEHIDKLRKNKSKEVVMTPFDKILKCKQEIKQAIKELDVEEEQLRDRLKQIDNTRAEWKQFTS